MRAPDSSHLRLLLTASAAAILLAACSQAATPPANQAAAKPVVSVVTAKITALPLTIELPGRTSARLVAEIRPQVSGIVHKRLFTECSEVKAGPTL